jgi:hypothetical protein
VSKSCPATIPDISRIVVPLFPQSSGPPGRRNPVFPTPLIKRSLAERSTDTPKSRKQASVEAQSALAAKLAIEELPSAIADIIAALCEIDLSPGRLISPAIRLALRTFIRPF